MTETYIRHISLKGKYLRFNEVTGPIEEVSNIAEKHRTKACYTNFSSGYIGVFASKDGPYLFINNEFLEFSDPSWEVKIEKLEDKHVFYLYQHGALLIKESYIPPPIDPLDMWANEESEDLYIWLVAKRNSKEIAAIWTLG